jgi:hypothetical protein
MTERIPLDDMTSDQLDQLHADLDRYEEVLAELNDTLVHRAKHSAHTETVLREVLALFTPLATMRDTGTVMAYSSDEVVDAHRMTRWRAALDAPKEQPGPAVPAPASWLTAGTRDLNIPAPPVPCPACARAGQAGLAPTEQHPGCRTYNGQEQPGA